MKNNKNNKLLVKDFTEDEIIGVLSSYQTVRKALIKGIGDDCAVCQTENSSFHNVYTSDATIEDVHFNSGERPERIGNKAIGRVLSDFAAMGAEPNWFLINLSLPQNYKISDLKCIYSRIKIILDEYNSSIIGGDLTKSEKLSFNIFGVGKIKNKKVVYRNNVNVNEAIWCTGQLGHSLNGRHLDFKPRIQEGKWLSEYGHAKSMIDITDGLVKDLDRLLTNNHGAILYEDILKKMSNIDDVLYNGEDYELLFTSSSNPNILRNNWKKLFSCELNCIGHITDRLNIYLKNDNKVNLLEVKGFQHF